MLSVIILTYYSIEFIKPCLDSIFMQDCQEFEVIIVDNGSKDGIVDFIKENYPQVILIKNEQNLGTCKARNQGVEVSKREWILTLDCDVILEKDFLAHALKLIKNLPLNVGLIQPRILNSDKKTIYSSGIYLSKLRRFHDIDKGNPDNGKFINPKYIFGACAAAAIYRRSMLEDIKENTGYFDERFFFLVEDVDLAWRAQNRGYKVLYSPETVCYHAGNSSGYDFKFRQYLCFRNRYFSILKNENAKIKLAYILILYDIPRIFYLLVTNKFTIKALKEIIEFYFGKPGFL